MKVVVAYGHEVQPVECVNYDTLSRDEQGNLGKMGKELALFVYHHCVGEFWQGLEQVAKEIRDLPTRRHYFGEPRQSDEEESVFE